MARAAKDLLDWIDFPRVECLNELIDKPFANALKQGYREDKLLTLQSDTDEQLLLHVPFTQAVKLHQLVITAPIADTTPALVKLFVNKPTIGFQEASDSPGDAAFELSDENANGEPLQLRLAKFQGVLALSIFVESNRGAEQTVVQGVQIMGTAGEVMNVAEIKKVGEEG